MLDGRIDRSFLRASEVFFGGPAFDSEDCSEFYEFGRPLWSVRDAGPIPLWTRFPMVGRETPRL